MEEKALSVSKAEQMLTPIAESYIRAFPEIENDKSFNAKQSMIALALRLNETVNKAGQPAVECCTKESIMQVAQEVLTKKLDPLKKQCALIVRGNKLTLQPQYQGNVRRALSLNPNLSHFNFVPIYKGDKVALRVMPDNKIEVASHETSFDNIHNANIAGGYVSAIAKDGSVFMTEIMNMEQIKNSWSQSSSNQDVHKKFPVKMVRKTLLNSICSWLIDQTGETLYEEDDGVEVENETYEVSLPNSEIIDGNLIIDDEDDEIEQQNEEVETESVQAIVVGGESVDVVEEAPNDEDTGEIVVDYKEWVNNYKATGEWEQIRGTYDSTNKTVKIRKKQ